MHASEVSEGCVSSFVPCMSSPKPSPHTSLFTYAPKREVGEKCGKNPHYFTWMHFSSLSSAAIVGGVQHHKLLIRAAGVHEEVVEGDTPG